MRRRTLLAGLSATLAGRSLAALADERAHVAALWPFVTDDPEGLALAATLRATLRDHGKSDLRITDYWGGGSPERTDALAAELVASAPKVIFTYLKQQLAAVCAVTRTIPVVSVGPDPVRSEYAASLQRPGGNVTGFMLYEPSLGGKWVAALKEAVPSIDRVALVSNPNNEGRYGNFFAEPFLSTATALGLEPTIATIKSESEIEPVITQLARQERVGVIVAPGTFGEANGDRIVAFVTAHRLPTLFAIRRFAYRGGLMAYGPDTTDAISRATAYVDRILNGENPAILPIQLPTRFDFIVNLETAQALGITFSSALLAQADEIVE
ncbi:ABC transporter substrate-binding protein [Methylobacterium sp. J-001]|uniref:ABC transporter substrate-binding protein n=1 Tax=Methylobacterium sp. J-001 TaxID=2836609 RepID=UPI001FBC1339|nr:ABC transporter substrate-binding protein [Methylobacterium sp. J-001]MCJ2115211.1 ABC transporter substrate-binding protein [Methylobacterium sp. J-001]